MKFAQPEQRVRNQEISHLVAAVIEDVGAPVGMLAFARIEMFIERGTVKAPQRKCIFRKMRRHPIHNHADPFLMKMIDKKTKIIGRAEAGRWSVSKR